MKEKTKEFLEALAEDMGYKLVKKSTPNIQPMLPSNLKDYSKLNSEMLIQEIKVLDDKIIKFKARNERLRSCTITFMEEKQPDHTKVVFDGTRFEPTKMIITDLSLTKYANLKHHIEALLKEMLAKEMTSQFMALNPEFKDKIDNMLIKTTPTGEALFVIVSEEKLTKAGIIDEPVEPVEEDKEDKPDAAGNPWAVDEDEHLKSLRHPIAPLGILSPEEVKAKAMEESQNINTARRGRGRPPKG